MSFGIDPRKLKKLVQLYHPSNRGEELKYMLYLKGEQQLYINLETCPFQGISSNSIEDRISTFGSNSLQLKSKSVVHAFLKSLKQFSINLPLILTIGIFILQLTTNPFRQENPQLQGLVMLMIAVINWLLSSLQDLWYIWKSRNSNDQLQEQICTVVRENKRQQLGSSELVVGDIVQLKEGNKVSADGWLIDGANIVTTEKYTSQVMQARKDNLRNCVMELKDQIQTAIAQKINEDLISQKSPILLSGSTIKTGEGRMIVLCVGKLSKQGQFHYLSHHKTLSPLMKIKMHQLRSTMLTFYATIAIIYSIFGILKPIVSGLMNSDWSQIQAGWQFDALKTAAYCVLIGIPQGLIGGVILGLFCIKVRVYLHQGIFVGNCQDLTKMASVTAICYDKQKDWGKTYYREWWNQQTMQFKREEPEGQQSLKKEDNIQTQENYLDLDDMNEYFRQIMTKSMKLRNSKQPGHQYIINQEATLKKNPTNDWTVLQETMQDQSLTYICENSMIKYVTMIDSRQAKQDSILFVKGYSEQILQKCSHFVAKSTGQVKQMKNQIQLQIRDIIKSMNRRLATTFAIAYETISEISVENSVKAIQQKKLTFLCLLGVSGTKDHSQYEIVRKLRESGVNLILVSSQGLQESINRSKYIGINTVELDSLTLQGKDFMKLIGDVICHTCKKSLCSCQTQSSFIPKLKNLQEFRRITKYFKVMSNATSKHKYALQVGLSNIKIFTAYLGSQTDDLPALAHSHIGIAYNEQLRNNQNIGVIFPNNSLKLLYSFINWSRFSTEFMRKYTQLVLPTCIVPATITLIGGVFFQQNPFTLLQLSWISIGLNSLSAINLSWQKPSQESMTEKQQQFGKDSPLVTNTVKKQVIAQSLLQTCLLLIIMVFGHLYIPQIPDQLDEIIGANWQVKYSDTNLIYVANGLYNNPLLSTPSYLPIFNNYGIFSRHLTIVYNILALMQIFNYFNCRRLKDKQINAIQGLNIQNIILFALTILAHYLFMELTVQHAAFYPHPLSLEHWLISSGLAMMVWLVGFLVRLLPSSSMPENDDRFWSNQSHNLGVKLVIKKIKLAEFETEDDLLFKNK